MSEYSGSDGNCIPVPDSNLDDASMPQTSVLSEDVHVTGTLVWYYSICHRQVWLMAHQITPDQDDANMEYGRFLQQFAYRRNRKQAVVGHSIIDAYEATTDRIVVVEIKKSSRFLRSATMQTLFYLGQLKARGIEASGEIRIPDERKRIPVELTDETIEELAKVEQAILKIIRQPLPEPPAKSRWCRNCAYGDFCWA